MPTCSLHEPGDVLCHWPKPVVRTDPEPCESPGLLARLGWEIAAFVLVAAGLITYIGLAR